MKGFALTVLFFFLFGLGPILDMVFHVPLIAIVWLYWGIAIGVPVGVLAHQAELQDRARRKHSMKSDSASERLGSE